MDNDKCINNFSTSLNTGTNIVDIQSEFYSWLKDKGIINKLQALIRKQMISTLEDSPMLNTNKRNITSPKIQAINLLVADFLMKQENLFTLSVFSVEVPLLCNLREFSFFVNSLGEGTQTIPVTKSNFQLNDIQDILEALGIQPNSDISELTCQYYFNETQVHSLLDCLFRSITTITNNLSQCNEVKVDQNSKETNKYNNRDSNTYEHRLNSWLVSVDDILCSFNLNEEQKNTLKMLLKKYHQNNNNQEATIYKEHIKKLEKKNKEVIDKVAEVEQMVAARLHSLDSKFMFQKEEVEYATQQLRLEQQQRYQLINVFEEKDKSMQEKLNKSEEEYNKKQQEIENKKYELRLKEMDILSREKMLKVESFNCSESNQIKLLQEQNIDLAKQLVKTKSKLYELEGYNKEIVKTLQNDNDEMRTFIKVLRQRNEELTNKASNLAKQLYNIDDSSKKTRFNNQSTSSTTTDYSTTLLDSDSLTEDDIIQEAESRLKTLEIKTAKVDQNFKNFQ